jgi:predicted DNA-binding transcriptional regulator AlpA
MTGVRESVRTVMATRYCFSHPDSTSNKPLATAKPWLACGISRAQWYKLASSGRTPLPVRLGTRRPVYLISELEAWLRAGAPDRVAWLKMREEEVR